MSENLSTEEIMEDDVMDALTEDHASIEETDEEREAREREVATRGYWRWLLISKKSIEDVSPDVEVVFSAYSASHNRFIYLVDFTGGKQALLSELDLLPNEENPHYRGLAFDDPIMDSESKLAPSESGIQQRIADVMS